MSRSPLPVSILTDPRWLIQSKCQLMDGLSQHSDTDVHSKPRERQAAVLERAVQKLVVVAAGVGLCVDDLIDLLDSGMTVGELLDYIGCKLQPQQQ